MTDPKLWKRLEVHRMDAAIGSEPYSVKLAQAEGWSKARARDVIQEYRKFLYLTQVSDSPVTPSHDIDRAWHMHMTFTRNYWDELCDKVLGEKLHHDPCLGREEMPRYVDQYAHTRALYREEFGTEPPRRVWPNGRRARAGTGSRICAGIGVVLVVLGGMLFALEQSKAGLALLVIGLGTMGASLVLAFSNEGKGGFAARRGDGSAHCGGGGCGGGGCGAG